MPRRAQLLQFAVAILLLLQLNSDTIAQPNVIHILADDMGWTDLQTGLTNLGNGSQLYQTPTLNQLAQNGLSFTSAHATQSCAPTRASLLTGQYANRTGVYSVGSINGNANNPLLGVTNQRQIANGTTTIAETLQAANYNTAHFGKFHVSQTANIISAHGFDQNFGGTNSGGPGGHFASQQGATFRFGGNIGPELDAYAAPYTQDYINQNLLPFANGANVNSLVGTPKHLSDAMADATVEYIGNQSGGSQPFYMNVSFHAPHAPLEPRADLLAKYNSIISNNGGNSPDPRHDDAGYAALLEGMDHAIGRIVASLADPNGDGDTSDSIAENTLIIFQGDNGGTTRSTSNAPLSGGKGDFTEGGTRVPMIAWMPGTISAGTTDQLIHPVDFYPTVADFVGADLPNPATHVVDGHSFAGLLRGETTTSGRKANFFHLPGYTRSSPSSVVTLDAGDNRIKVQYEYESRSFNIYDLRGDIGETNNLTATGNLSNLQYKLAARGVRDLRNWLDTTGADYPTLRSDGSPIPPPNHLPEIRFALGQSSGTDLNGLTNGQVTQLGTTLSVTAVGSDATFDADATSLGVESLLDNGGPNQRRRIDGQSAAEAIEFSFDRDVFLKSLDITSLDSQSDEQILLEFVSGENPFIDLDGYDDGGFALSSDSLSFAAAESGVGGGQSFSLEFGELAQDEIFLAAGTVLSLTANPAESGGILLEGISIAEPLTAVDQILVDYNLDGTVDDLDRNLWATTFGSTLDLRADGNGNGIVDAADFTIWREAYDNSLANAVPEPSGTGLIIVSMLACLATQRRRKAR